MHTTPITYPRQVDNYHLFSVFLVLVAVLVEEFGDEKDVMGA